MHQIDRNQNIGTELIVIPKCKDQNIGTKLTDIPKCREQNGFFVHIIR